MIKKGFWGLTKLQIEYEKFDLQAVQSEIMPVPTKVTLLAAVPYAKEGALLKSGDKVQIGQKLKLYTDSDAYVTASVNGEVTSLAAYTGNFGQKFTAVAVKTDLDQDQEVQADALNLDANDGDAIVAALEYVPGAPPLKAMLEHHIDTIVVCGVDGDLLVQTNKFIMGSKIDAINKGISILKKISGAHHAVVVLPPELSQTAGRVGGASGAELRIIEGPYPAASEFAVAVAVLGQTLPAGQSFQDAGLGFFSAEAVASIGEALQLKTMPVTKTLTLINKNLEKIIVQTRLGTPLGELFNAFDISVNEKDRIIVGGPMTGEAVYSEEHPVLPSTDAVMVQEGHTAPLYSDYPCINCGDCIRICPANVPVSMLVRLCEAGEYEQAADHYDLYSCIECGLCTLVCVARMPVLQYLKLAKYELEHNEEEE